MATSFTKKKALVGAPSQHKQASRKGKSAWRKNVDLQDIETGLENVRAEEIAIGSAFQSKRNEELFHIDVKGDEQIRNSLPRRSKSKSQLTSTKILSQRSAVPAVFSRTVSQSKRRPRHALSPEQKARLLRIGKRLRKGPFNSFMDPTEFGSGSALLEVSEAVKMSGNDDPWTEDTQENVIRDDFMPIQEKVKPPTLPHPRDVIEAPAIAEPHMGTSYNPPLSAHQELLLKAHQVEERRLKEATKHAAIKVKLEQGWNAETEDAMDVAPGMLVHQSQLDTDDREDQGADYGFRTRNRLPERKTKKQRRKAARLLAEKRAISERVSRKRMLSKVESAKLLWRVARRATATREQTRADRQQALLEKAKKGLAGQRIGKHKVREGEVDVQLGEELSETLRELKPEGNLFRDRFLSLQNRALVEPGTPVFPKRRSNRIKEYEKPAWRRFK